MTRRLLVVGAREGSLGESIARNALTFFPEVKTIGISGREDIDRDLTQSVLPDGFTDVVCTMGINLPSDPGVPNNSWRESMWVNAVRPMELLDGWLEDWMNIGMADGGEFLNFVYISSNSASIPRSGSAAYCASKAALSMGIRAHARSISRDPQMDGVNVWGYEPCWIDSTPMSEEVRDRLRGKPDPKMHRCPREGWQVDNLATVIIADLIYRARHLHGTLIDLGRGEV